MCSGLDSQHLFANPAITSTRATLTTSISATLDTSISATLATSTSAPLNNSTSATLTYCTSTPLTTYGTVSLTTSNSAHHISPPLLVLLSHQLKYSAPLNASTSAHIPTSTSATLTTCCTSAPLIISIAVFLAPPVIVLFPPLRVP